jgi:undecaprenyl-diphosphatase
MGVLEAVILGLVQGLTEFLPVSSSGHIELGKAILNIGGSENLLFSVLVHGATALSTIVVFRKDIWTIMRDLLRFQLNESTVYTFKILLSMIPVGLLGIFFKDEIEGMFTGNILLVGSMLLVTALLLTFAYFKKPGSGDVTYKNAFIIGIAQALAIVPGISRSGATISTGLLAGIEKDKVARFSFLMVLIPILGASALELKAFIETSEDPGTQKFYVLFTGFVAAFFAGIMACSWMIRIVRRGKLIYFAIYCLLIGLLAITVHFL